MRARQQIALEAGGKAQAVDVIAVHTVPDGGHGVSGKVIGYL